MYLSDRSGLFLEETRRDPSDLGILVFARPRSNQIVARVLRVENLDELILGQRQERGACTMQIARCEIAICIVDVGFLSESVIESVIV